MNSKVETGQCLNDRRCYEEVTFKLSHLLLKLACKRFVP